MWRRMLPHGPKQVPLPWHAPDSLEAVQRRPVVVQAAHGCPSGFCVQSTGDATGCIDAHTKSCVRNSHASVTRQHTEAANTHANSIGDYNTTPTVRKGPKDENDSDSVAPYLCKHRRQSTPRRHRRRGSVRRQCTRRRRRCRTGCRGNPPDLWEVVGATNAQGGPVRTDGDTPSQCSVNSGRRQQDMTPAAPTTAHSKHSPRTARAAGNSQLDRTRASNAAHA